MESFENHLYIDPLTGRNNFFRFLQSDFQKLFGHRGMVMIIDIANFLMFNERFGTEKGDLCLKILSDSIDKVLLGDNATVVFRTHGDEFTLIFSGKTIQYADNICNLLKKEFTSKMNSYGFNDMELHTLIFNYDSVVDSIESYYELLIQKSLNQSKKVEDKFTGEKLLRNIIRGITNRIRDTLSVYKDAYNFALVDDVSGLANHRAGKAFLTNLLEEYKIKKTQFSVLFIDGDNLKRYNEISYEAGNEMIKKLGEIISSSVRSEDKVYRWLSGDEFLVVLNGTNELNAINLADRIRKRVEEETKEMIYPTTISLGLACYPEDGCSIEEIISKAERANALAKSSGKNKVVKWSVV